VEECFIFPDISGGQGIRRRCNKTRTQGQRIKWPEATKRTAA